MALAMMGNNEKTQCIGNDFNIENAFANVVVSGKIREYQGDPNLNLQADNCFDPSAPQDIRTMPSALPFEYILLQGDVSCHRPDNTGQNYTILVIDADEQMCLDVRQGITGDINNLISIQSDIALLESNSQNLSTSERYLLVSLKSDFFSLESKLLEDALSIGDELMIENIISIPSSKENRDLISYYQQLGNLNKAQQEIAALPADQISVDFADIQLLYNDILSTGVLITMDSTLETELLDQVKNNDMNSPYSRAMLALLSDHRVEPELPMELLLEVKSRSEEINGIDKSSGFAIIPNPSNGQFRIAYTVETLAIRV